MKWDICKPNEAYMAGSCSPSRAEANCVLLLSKQMSGREKGGTEGETSGVNEGDLITKAESRTLSLLRTETQRGNTHLKTSWNTFIKWAYIYI